MGITEFQGEIFGNITRGILIGNKENETNSLSERSGKHCCGHDLTRFDSHDSIYWIPRRKKAYKNPVQKEPAWFFLEFPRKTKSPLPELCTPLRT